MNLKKLFLYELAAGIVSAIALLLIVFYAPGIILNNITLWMFVSWVLVIYLQIIHRKKEWWSEEDLILLKKTWRVTGMVLMVFMAASYFFETKSSTRGQFSYFLIFFVFFGSLFLLIRSALGLFLLRKRTGEPEGIYEKFNEAVPAPEGFLIVNHTSFIEAVIFGVSIWGMSYFTGSYQAIRILILLPLICIPFFFTIYNENVRKKKQRRIDEMEKNILYKTTSYAAGITLFFMSALYEIKDLSISGKFINEAWGILIIAGFFVIWGITGSVILAKRT